MPSRARLFFVEASKVGTQHISLIDGYLQAIASSSKIKQTFDIVVRCHDTLYSELGQDTQHNFAHESIPVIDPNTRRFVPKILLEVWVVLQTILRARKNDIVFVSCVMPTALWMIEGLTQILRRRVFVMLHGEVEGFYDKQKSSFKNYGYWSKRWIQLRRSSSKLYLVVLDKFIRDRLLKDFPYKIRPEQIFTIHHPITFLANPNEISRPVPRACFIGYRTGFKGYEDFESIARELTAIEFVAIGGGKLEHVPSGQFATLKELGGYLPAIADCDVAIFPYVGGYTASLSAAALDALSAGIHIIATDRPFFTGLAEQFGPEVITICSNTDQIRQLLNDSNWVARQRESRGSRLARLAVSPYNKESIRKGFEQLITAAT